MPFLSLVVNAIGVVLVAVEVYQYYRGRSAPSLKFKSHIGPVDHSDPRSCFGYRIVNYGDTEAEIVSFAIDELRSQTGAILLTPGEHGDKISHSLASSAADGDDYGTCFSLELVKSTPGPAIGPHGPKKNAMRVTYRGRFNDCYETVYAERQNQTSKLETQPAAFLRDVGAIITASVFWLLGFGYLASGEILAGGITTLVGTMLFAAWLTSEYR